MALYEELQADLKAAMKARSADRVAVLRMLLADLQKQQLNAGRDLTDKDELEMLSRQAKQRRESIEAFTKAGRTELADKEAAELKIIEELLPAQLSPEEVKAMAQEVIAEVGASSMKEMGMVMGKLMPKLKGRFPGKDVGPIVRSLLP